MKDPIVDSRTLQPPTEQVFLSDYSSRDAVWDVRKALADQVSQIYARVAEYEKLSQRINQCSGVLLFNWQKDQETGKNRLRLRGAQFCRVRYCCICQWRRSLMLQARFFEALPEIVSQFPTARWVFLTLTLKNCPIEELGTTLVHMNKSWQRFIERKDLSSVLGWARTTEVTRALDGKAHPHFHTLMMVPSNWFTKNYIKQSALVELWQKSLRVDYKPIVDIRNVKVKFSSDPSSQFTKEMQSAVAETIKYSTKSKHVIEDPDWLIELTKQTHKKRFIATGGALKDVFKVDEETNEDLLLLGDKNPDDGSRIGFDWQRKDKRYKRFKKYDQLPLS
jgi:plasmid rolling circle replication initiator protein Rep